MTTLQKTSRASFVRQRRTSKTRIAQTPQRATPKRATTASKQTTQTARQSYRLSTVYLPGEPRRIVSRTPNRSMKNSPPHGYDIAFSIGRTAVHAPRLALPQFGTRWTSGVLTLLLIFILYTLWNASTFRVKTAEIHGNQRLSTAEVNAMLGMIGQPIFKVIPTQIATNLRNALTDLASVEVIVGFPNRITVNVVERLPVLTWSQDGAVKWIDVNGMAFTPHGDVTGLVQVKAANTPQVPLDPALPLYEQKFIAPEMVQALLALATDVPAGMTMTFDPMYGMGWQDPRGWTVYFGQTTKDILMKKMVYQAIVDTLTRQGVQPSLISVEYLDAPFYK
jgi:cell division protein FtsQ